MAMDPWMSVLSGLLGAGGILGAKGAIDRYLSSRQALAANMEREDQKRETAIIDAVIESMQTGNTAMIGLAKEAFHASRNVQERDGRVDKKLDEIIRLHKQTYENILIIITKIGNS